jgi:hypothetical protein
LKRANSSGELTNGSAPRSVSRALKSGRDSAAFTERLIFSMIAAGVFFGALMPCQPVARSPTLHQLRDGVE